jgi:hypothetical protein
MNWADFLLLVGPVAWSDDCTLPYALFFAMNLLAQLSFQQLHFMRLKIAPPPT